MNQQENFGSDYAMFNDRNGTTKLIGNKIIAYVRSTVQKMYFSRDQNWKKKILMDHFYAVNIPTSSRKLVEGGGRGEGQLSLPSYTTRPKTKKGYR